MRSVKFDKNHSKDFVTDLRKEVDDYFRNNNISRYGNLNMILKSFVMIGLFYGSYALMISGLMGTTWLLGPMVVNGCWFSRHRDVCNARWKSRCLLKKQSS